MKPDAEKSIKGRLVLEAIAKTEALEVTDVEVEDELKRMSAFYDFINTLDLEDFDKRKS